MATTSRKLTGGAGGLLAYFEERELPGLEGYYRQRDRDREDTERRSDDVVFHEVWGKYAERLGLTEMTREQFTSLVNGEWEGERLVGAGYRKVVDRETGEVRTETGVRTTMIDVVYAAPKSVMTYLVHQDDRELTAAVIEAWRESVREAFEGMEEHARVARVPVKTPTEAGRRTVRHGARAGEESRMQGSATKRVPAELIALPVLQLSARPTAESLARGYVADPHLHMHVPIIAVCAVPDPDNPESVRTYTPDEVGIKRQAAERDAVVMGEFARRLEDLGIELEYHTDQKGRITWEVAGIPREASLRFSTNHLRAEWLKEQFRDQYGRPPTDPELAELLRNTRLPKDADAKQVDERGAWQAWHDDLASTGIEIDARPPEPGRVERESLAERYVELRDRLLAPSGLHREHEAVDRDAVRLSIARAAIGLGLTREELRTFEARFTSELIPVRTASDPQFDLFALPHLIEAEVWVGSDIEARAAAHVAAPTWGAKHRALSDSRVRLSSEQREAIDAMCADTGWANLVGRAGTGKTTVLRTVVEALHDRHGDHEPAADRVIVVSTSNVVAQRSGRSIGADRSYSIDGFAAAVASGLEVTDRTWILVDEAAAVDTPHMKLLLDAAGPAVIRAIGDDRQLPAIGPAGWYAEQLAQHPGAELTHVYRQRSADDVRDYTDLGAGKVEEAVRSLDARGRVHVVDSFGDRAPAIVDLYRQERRRGRDAGDVTVIVDSSNHALDDLNRRIQRERLVMEEIGGPPLQVRATDADRSWSLYRGDLVVFRQRTVGTDGEVVRNGLHGEITRITDDGRVSVRLEDSRTVEFQIQREAHTQPLLPAYAVHQSTAIGGEVPVVILSPSRHATRNSAYTGLTRAAEDAHIVTDRETHGARAVEGLIRDWSRVAEKRTARSQLGEAGRDRWAAWKAGVGPRAAVEPEPVSERGGDAAAPARENQEAEPASAPYAPRHAEPEDGDDVDDTAAERTPERPRHAAAPVREVHPAPPHAAPSVPRHGRAADADDLGERARDAKEREASQRDLEEVRAAARDLGDVEAEWAAEAEDREAEESLVHDVDVPPQRRFGDLDSTLAAREECVETSQWHRPAGPAPDPVPDPDLSWDLDAALQRARERRWEEPELDRPPPDRGIGG